MTGLNELDTVTELVDAGLDTIDFSAITTPVQLNLGLATPQTVHGTRSIKLNSPSTFENVSGGSGDDILVGNNRANILLGHAGNDTLSGFGNRDMLIGGLGMDTLLGGTDQDILIPCTTTHDQTMRALNELISEWSSASSYAQRVTNLKNGVGASGVALEPLVDVLDDNDALDQMSGEVNTDWFFKDASDVILDLNGEIVEAL